MVNHLPTEWELNLRVQDPGESALSGRSCRGRDAKGMEPAFDEHALAARREHLQGGKFARRDAGSPGTPSGKSRLTFMAMRQGARKRKAQLALAVDSASLAFCAGGGHGSGLGA